MNVEVVIFGRNENEQLGLNVRNSKCLPTKLNFENSISHEYLEREGIRLVRMGGNRLAFVTFENNLMITLNDYRNNNVNSSTVHRFNACKLCAQSDKLALAPHTHFENISHDIYLLKNNILDVGLGFSHCIMLTKDNLLYGFGTNGNFRLGVSHEAVNMEDTVSRMFSQFYNVKCFRIEVEHYLDAEEEVVSVNCLGQGTICKTNFNNLIMFGWSYRGELATKTEKQSPRKETFFSERNLTIEKIFTGYSQVFYLVKTKDKETKLFVCGWNETYQLGLLHNDNMITITENNLPFVPDIKDIALGYDHSLILTNDGTVYMLGGKARFNFTTAEAEPLQEFPNISRIKTRGKVTRISSGYYHIILVVDDYKIYTAGANECYQCGVNDDVTPSITSELNIRQHYTANLSLVGAGQFASAIIFSHYQSRTEAQKRMKSMLFKYLLTTKLSDIDFDYFP